MTFSLIEWRDAWRWNWKHRTSTVGIVVVLASGVSLVTSIFALADPFLMRSLPYRAPDDLVVIDTEAADTAVFGVRDVPTLRDWRDRTDLFAQLESYRRVGQLRLQTSSGGLLLRTIEASSGLFQLLLDDSTIVRGSSATLPVFLTDRGWTKHFGKDMGVVNTVFERQTGGQIRIEGVLPRDFVFPSDKFVFPIDAILPLNQSAEREPASPSITGMTLVGRVHSGVTIPHLATALRSTLPAGLSLTVRSMNDYLTSRFRAVAAGALCCGLLLVLVCAGSLANFLLGSGSDRVPELATRTAIGSGPRALFRLLTIEVLILTSTGGLVGVMLAKVFLKASSVVVPMEYLALGQPILSLRPIVFGILSGLCLFLVGALAQARVLHGVYGSSLGATVAAATPRRPSALRFGVIAFQLALTIVLLFAALLLSRSYLLLYQQGTGLSPDTLAITTSYPDDNVGEHLQADIDASIGSLRTLPGVRTVGASVGSMLDRSVWAGGLVIDAESTIAVATKFITADYFEATGSKVVIGRHFDSTDRAESAAIVNESLARRLWPNQDAVGRLIGRRHETEIVGVVRDSFDVALDRQPQPTVFRLLHNPSGCVGDCNNITYVIGLSTRQPHLLQLARAAIVGVNRDAVVIDSSSLGERLASSIKTRAFAMIVLCLFAGTSVAVGAAALGSVVAFTATRRRREVAIRVVLGATVRNVAGLLLREVLIAALLGVSGGLVLGRWASVAMQHLLFGVKPGDLSTAALSIALMLILVTVCAVVPILRVARVPPTVALRSE